MNPSASSAGAVPALPSRRELREAERRAELAAASGAAVASAPAEAFPSRRALREAEARRAAQQEQAVPAEPVAAAAAGIAPEPVVVSAPPAAAPAATIPVPIPVPAAPVGPMNHTVVRRPVTAASVRGVRPVAVKPVYSDEPTRSHTKKPRRRFSGLITMLAVGGLFASAALPAYALTAGSANAATSGVQTDDAASASLNLAGHGAPIVDRQSFDATSEGDLVAQRANAITQANYDAYMKSGAQELGDDYPWFSSASYNQGGTLSPLNYYYRECVDFVAWRLNRDAGVTQAPWKYTWSDLTPGGGNASQWLGAWRAHGWTVSTTPKVGSVAWFPYNHVAYVSKVNADGTVLLEEYNYQSDHLYGQRTVAATDVAEYLYAPPR